MVAERETVPYSHNISLLIRVVISEHLQQLDLYLSLLMKFFLILQNFECHMLFLRVSMVHTAKDYTERSSTQLLHYFISVIYLIRCIVQVIAVFRVETIVKLLY